MGNKSERISVDITLPDWGDSEAVSRYKKDYQKAYKEKYRKQTSEIRITVSKDEYQKIQDRAKRNGKSVSSYVMAYFYAKEKGSEVKSKFYYDLVKEFHRVGVNVNQIARVLNMGAPISLLSFELKKVKKGLDDILDKLR